MIIMTKVVAKTGLKGLARLRLVSKACKAAFSNYPATYMVKTGASVSQWDPADLIPLLPNLSCLDVHCYGHILHIADLEAFSQLTCIIVQEQFLHWEGSKFCNDLLLSFGSLPSSLKALRLGLVNVTSHLRYKLRAAQLIELRLTASAASTETLCDVLRDLTSLQASYWASFGAFQLAC